jgi:serine/threonine-protein kinase HipA
MSKPGRVKTLRLHTTQGAAGALLRESQFVVRYGDDALAHPERAIALTMPVRPEGWSSNRIPPVLAMNLPEGFLRDRVLQRYRKVMDVDDDMNMLAVTSTPAAGRVWAGAEDDERDGPGPPMALRDILAHRGTESLFDELLERYSTASISGVQPKVLVPEKANRSARAADKSAAKSPDLIVKSAGAEYPGLAENEFHCMSIARHVGLESPEFHLSEDRELFVIRRFDMGPHGYLGFEDLAALTGRHPDRKYDSSYGEVAKAVSLNVAPFHRTRALDDLFKLVVLNCIVRNGDAHLKNFGVLYGDPRSADQDARLAPVYDLVCTTIYLPKDLLALGIAGSKAWPDRRALEKFGAASCNVARPERVIDEVVERALEFTPDDRKSKIWRAIRKQMEAAVQALAATRKPVRRRNTARTAGRR